LVVFSSPGNITSPPTSPSASLFPAQRYLAVSDTRSGKNNTTGLWRRERGGRREEGKKACREKRDKGKEEGKTKP